MPAFDEADRFAFPAPEVFQVSMDTDEVCCDGGGGPLGHPLVYYTFDGRDAVECGYCDRRFVKEEQEAVVMPHDKVSEQS